MSPNGRVVTAVLGSLVAGVAIGFAVGRVGQPRGVHLGRASLVYFPVSARNPSEGGIRAASAIVRFLASRESDGCEEAVRIYDVLLHTENFGGEYSALRWLCVYTIADEAEQARLRLDHDGDRLLRYFEVGGWSVLRQYLVIKYGLAAGSRAIDANSFNFTDELLRFGGPGRTEWERTDALMDALDVKPGQVVADIGAGTGFHAFRLAERVGPTGTTYAVELDLQHLQYMRSVVRSEGLTNVEVLEGSPTATGLPPDSVDLIFMSATYQAIYANVRAPEREAWIADARAALRPGGRLVLLENVPDEDIEDPTALPYRGISISKRLIVAQLEAYGFRLVAEHQFIPQRYVVAFEDASR